MATAEPPLKHYTIGYRAASQTFLYHSDDLIEGERQSGEMVARECRILEDSRRYHTNRLLNKNKHIRVVSFIGNIISREPQSSHTRAQRITRYSRSEDFLLLVRIILRISYQGINILCNPPGKRSGISFPQVRGRKCILNHCVRLHAVCPEISLSS